jgi:hypothetical protein
MAFVDYPIKWPSIAPSIYEGLTSQDQKGWLTGLMSLNSLVKKYRYDAERDSRKEL